MRRLVNIMFLLLLIGTVALGIYVLRGECAADSFTLVVVMIYGPLVAGIVFGCEYFWWRSTLLLVSCADEKPVVIGASMVNAILAAGSLVYMTFGAFQKVGLPFSVVLYAFAVQLFCRFLIWINR